MAERVLGHGEEGRGDAMTVAGGLDVAKFLISAITFVRDLMDRSRDADESERKAWFERDVQPSYEKLVEVDRDYRTQFSQAAELLRTKRDLPQVVRILKAARLEQLFKREEVRAHVLALREYQLSKKRKPRLVVSFFAYINAVEAYFSAASPLPHATWYGSFIEQFSRLVEEKQDPFAYAYPETAQGETSIPLAIDKLESAVHDAMPEAMRHVLEAYMDVRRQCLPPFS
jgi:hypothetical protein